MPAPEGGKVSACPGGVRGSACAGRLTPSGSRLGFIPSLRARASRGTSLCFVFLLFRVLVVFRVVVLYFIV